MIWLAPLVAQIFSSFLPNNRPRLRRQRHRGGSGQRGAGGHAAAGTLGKGKEGPLVLRLLLRDRCRAIYFCLDKKLKAIRMIPGTIMNFYQFLK